MHDLRTRDPYLVLPLLLRPVERVVGEPYQCGSVASLCRVGGEPSAECDRRFAVTRVERPHPGDDRLRCRERAVLAQAGEEQRELVAAQAKRLAALPQPCRDPREHAVARRVAEAVVDELEVVEVEEHERQASVRLFGEVELPLQALVEVPVVAEPGERIGQCEPDRAQLAMRRTLIEGDRDQRARERREHVRRPLPEDDEHQRGRRHQRERHCREAHVRAHEAEVADLGAGGGDCGRHDGDVDDVEDRGSDGDFDERSQVRAVGAPQRQPGDRAAQAERAGVEKRADERPAFDQRDKRRGGRIDERGGPPAEEHETRDREDEAERYAVRVSAVDRHREPLGERRGDQERPDAEEQRGRGGPQRERGGRREVGSDPGR